MPVVPSVRLSVETARISCTDARSMGTNRGEQRPSLFVKDNAHSSTLFGRILNVRSCNMPLGLARSALILREMDPLLVFISWKIRRLAEQATSESGIETRTAFFMTQGGSGDVVVIVLLQYLLDLKRKTLDKSSSPPTRALKQRWAALTRVICQIKNNNKMRVK